MLWSDDEMTLISLDDLKLDKGKHIVGFKRRKIITVVCFKLFIHICFVVRRVY